MTEEANNVFWTYFLIGVGGFGLITFLVVCWDGICEVIDDFVTFFLDDDLDDEDDDDYCGWDGFDARAIYHKPARKRKSIKWRIFVPFISYRRRQWLEKQYGRQADRKCKDAVAETLATHQDILEALYGKAPSMRKIYRRIKEQYRE